MNGSNNKKSNPLILALIVLSAIAICWIIIWHLRKDLIIYHSFKSLWNILALFDISAFPFVRELRNELAVLATQPISFKSYFSILNKVGYFFIAIPLAIFALTFMNSFKHSTQKLKRVITAQNLPHIMSNHSPAVTPVLHYGDLMNKDIEGQESRLHPEEWAIKFGILNNNKFDRANCLKQLELQLGPIKPTIDNLSLYEKVLFVIFGVRVFGDFDDVEKAQKWLDELNHSCRKGSFNGKAGYPDLQVINKILKEGDAYIFSIEAKEFYSHYQYPSTALYALHTLAVKRGKLPSSHFRWLKGIDRGLWYTLNGTGRLTPCIESIIQIQFSKYQTLAKENSKKLLIPFYEDVINAIENYLIKTGYLPKPQSEHTDKKET